MSQILALLFGGSADVVPCEKLNIINNCVIEQFDPQGLCKEALVKNSTLIYKQGSVVEKCMIEDSEIQFIGDSNFRVGFDTCEIVNSKIEALNNCNGIFTMVGERFVLKNNIFKNFKGKENSNLINGVYYPYSNNDYRNSYKLSKL